MDFDYQAIKDAESYQREKLLRSQPIQHPRPSPRPSAPESQLSIRKPPIKPRRSIKMRPAAKEDAGQLSSQANQKENEVVVKRVAPSQLLHPKGLLESQAVSLQAHNLMWFETTQLPRLHAPGSPWPCWLHGFATRREAEKLLQDKQQGCFLLRFSESKVGFVLSYRGADRCRHFIIQEESKVPGSRSQYLIAGELSKHDSLEELIEYYTHNPVEPFNETLTTPCVQGNSSCEVVAKLGEVTRDSGTEKSESALQHSGQGLPTGSTHSDNQSAQYATVRKALRKTQSLPEYKIGPDLTLPVKDARKYSAANENDIQEPAVGSPTRAAADDLTQPVEAPYARVNKPPRAALQNPSVSTIEPRSQGAAADISSQSLTTGAEGMAEQKYCELEPLHTYEETLHIRDKELDFYAMNRRKEIADLSSHHLYSEVNIKGARDDLIPMQAPPPRAVPMCNSTSRPKPPIRSAHASSRPETSVQSLGRAPGMSALNHSEQQLPASTAFSIYEQIPERPSNSRPPLPPPNPKR